MRFSLREIKPLAFSPRETMAEILSGIDNPQHFYSRTSWKPHLARHIQEFSLRERQFMGFFLEEIIFGILHKRDNPLDFRSESQ